jgi:ATP-dependent metalloprotease FtsH
MFTEKAQMIVDLAKDCAFARGKSELDIESLLAAVGSDTEAGVRLAECLADGDVAGLRARCPELGRPAPCPGKLDLAGPFQGIITVAMELASAGGVPDRAHPGLIDIRHLVCAIAMSRDACRELGGLRPMSRADAIRILTVWYEDFATAISIADIMAHLRNLRTELLSKVFGQDHAVHAFVEGVYNAEITSAAEKERRRPIAVFVFAGPPGVGKTYMSELCAAYLSRPFKRFDMTGFSDHQAHNQLVGFAPSYQAAQPGILTGFVAKNPNAFLLFDEIEKAHLNTIQLFYQILDAGRLEDKYMGRDVSFRDTIIVFTTNAGRSLYDNPNKVGIGVANSSYHKRTILSALENERNPSTGHLTFPPTICSRLAQGYPVMFNHLGINELERVSAAEMARTETLLERQYFKRFSHDPLLPISLVFREGGRADARHLHAETEKFIKSELFKFASLYAQERLEDVFADIDQVHFECELAPESSEPEVQALYEPVEKPKVLLVANSRFVDLCRKHVSDIEWLAATSPGEVLDVLAVGDPDMVLLDIWVRRDENRVGVTREKREETGKARTSLTTAQGLDFMPLSARALDQGRTILKKVRERFPEIPIYLLSFTSDASPGQSEEVSEGPYKRTMTIDVTQASLEHDVMGVHRRPVDDELFMACVRAGGARGLVTTDFLQPSGKDWEAKRDSFAGSVKELTRRLYREKKARALARERKVLAFETSANLDKTQRQLIIRLRDFHLGRAVEAADAGELVDDVQRPSTRFEDVLGAKAAKDSLQFIIDWLRDPKRYRAMDVRPPKGILLIGPPGTGKTMLARALAGESNCAFIEKSATSFVTVWQGSGPQNVRDLFERARRYAPAIVFIDEIDAIGRKRGGLGGAARAEEETLNAFLTEMDGFSAPMMEPVIVLAATNVAEHLDDALRRRFDRSIEIERPDRAVRLQYLERTRERKNCEVTRTAIERLAGQTTGMTIADLERIVHEAAVTAAQSGKPLTDAILEEAFETIRMGEAKDSPSLPTLERIARHEAGHTVIAWLAGNRPVQVTIVGRGNAGGFMEREGDETRIIYTKPEIEQRIREAMGGRAAEIVYYGKDEGLSSGVATDLQHATAWAAKMVKEYGMNEALGQVALPDAADGRAMDGPLAAKTMEAAEHVVRQELDNAIRVLEQNRENLEQLVGGLLEKNRLTCEELEDILPSAGGAG